VKSLLVAGCCSLLTTQALAQSAGPDPLATPALDGYSYAPEGGDVPAHVEVEKEPARRIGSAFVLRAGGYVGNGSAHARCEGDGCTGSSESASYSEEITPTFSFDWLSNASQNFRLGIGFGWTPTMKVSDEAGSFELGTDFGTDLVFEGVFDLSNQAALTVRGSVGLSMLFPSGDLEREADEMQQACDGYLEYCDVDRGPYLGVRAAVGSGLLYDLGGVGLRADFQLQVYSYRTLGIEVSGVEAWVALSGLRPMLLAGIEL
jgi:hypothetical protein